MSLRYTDRSRYEAGLGRCGRLRYLKYHAGPSSYGFERSARSMPLIAGGATHDALAEILGVVKARDSIDALDPHIRHAISVQTHLYRKRVTAHGIQQVGEVDDAALNRLITEQSALITGMVWAWCLEILPWLHTEFKILDIEREEEYVLGCTCTLGDGLGTFAEHEARGCNGIGLQGRSDFLTEKRETRSLAWHEFKTTGYGSEAWESKFETSMQAAIGMLCAEHRLEQEIGEFYVHGLFKGARSKKKMPGDIGRTRTGPKFQDSPFCVAYCQPGNPPLVPDDWQSVYEWFDEAEGKVRRLGKKYQKRPISEYPIPADTGDIDPAEYWVRFIPAEVRKSQLQLLGPLNRQSRMIESMPDEIGGEEARWTSILGHLHKVAVGIGPNYWTDPLFQTNLNRLVPRSYECRRYGKEHQCEMFKICFGEPGWENPFEEGVYRLRAPHHEAERAQMQARGLEPPEVEEQEEG